MATYSELLKDPRWQRKRLEILNRSDFTCECCEAADKTLHVHHKIYRKGAKPWEYEDHELQALCEACHEQVTHVRERLNEAIALLDGGDLEELLGYAEGLGAKAHIFDNFDDEQYRPAARTWPLTSWSQARGFAVSLCRPIRSESVYRIIDLAPLDNGAVWDLGTGGEPILDSDGDTECNVLGALLRDPQAWQKLHDHGSDLYAQDFSDATHQDVFRAIEQLARMNQPLSAANVNRLLGKPEPAVQHDYLEWLATCAPPDFNLLAAADVVRQSSPMRSRVRRQG